MPEERINIDRRVVHNFNEHDEVELVLRGYVKDLKVSDNYLVEFKLLNHLDHTVNISTIKSNNCIKSITKIITTSDPTPLQEGEVLKHVSNVATLTVLKISKPYSSFAYVCEDEGLGIAQTTHLDWFGYNYKRVSGVPIDWEATFK